MLECLQAGMRIALFSGRRSQAKKSRPVRTKQLWSCMTFELSSKGGGSGEEVHEAVRSWADCGSALERPTPRSSRARAGEDAFLLRAEHRDSRGVVPGLPLSRSGARLLRAGLPGLSAVRAGLDPWVL